MTDIGVVLSFPRAVLRRALCNEITRRNYSYSERYRSYRCSRLLERVRARRLKVIDRYQEQIIRYALSRIDFRNHSIVHSSRPLERFNTQYTKYLKSHWVLNCRGPPVEFRFSGEVAVKCSAIRQEILRALYLICAFRQLKFKRLYRSALVC